jgi:hypothetical protein
LKRIIIASVVAFACGSGGVPGGGSDGGNPMEPNPAAPSPTPPPVISVGGAYNTQVDITRSCDRGGTARVGFLEPLVVLHTPGATGQGAIIFESATYNITSSLNPDGAFAGHTFFTVRGLRGFVVGGFIGRFTISGFAGQIFYTAWTSAAGTCDWHGTITGVRAGGRNMIP